MKAKVPRQPIFGFSNPECLVQLCILALTLAGIGYGLGRTSGREGMEKIIEPAFFGLVGFMVIPTIIMSIWSVMIIRRRLKK